MILVSGIYPFWNDLASIIFKPFIRERGKKKKDEFWLKTVEENKINLYYIILENIKFGIAFVFYFEDG